MSLTALTQASGQNAEGIHIIRAGLNNSFKTQGISLMTNSNRKENTFNSYLVGLDTYGIYQKKTTQPGVKFQFSHNTVLSYKEITNGVFCLLYAGGGGVAGYVKDYASTMRNSGVLLGITASAGGLLAFSGTRFELGMDFTAEMGLHLRKMVESNGSLGLSWYANGLIRALIPQILIYYRF